MDFRTDIYSLGVIIYEALSGKPPFVAASATEILVMQLTVTPTPLREGLAHVPAQVEAAVMRALAKERADRFDSVASFVSALYGQGVAAQVASAGPSMDRATAAASAPSASGIKRPATAPSITTFSRATGEVEASAGDGELPAAARSRRWPFLALGGLAAAGLALFLFVRFSPGPTPETATGSLGAAVPAAPASAAAALQQGATPSPVALGGPDAGAAVAPAATKPASASAAPVAVQAASAARPSPAAEHRHQAGKKKNAEEDWALH